MVDVLDSFLQVGSYQADDILAVHLRMGVRVKHVLFEVSLCHLLFVLTAIIKVHFNYILDINVI